MAEQDIGEAGLEDNPLWTRWIDPRQLIEASVSLWEEELNGQQVRLHFVASTVFLSHLDKGGAAARVHQHTFVCSFFAEHGRDCHASN